MEKRQPKPASDEPPIKPPSSAEPGGASADEPLPRLSGSLCPELDDVVDIASMESFPASDPPGYLFRLLQL